MPQTPTNLDRTMIERGYWVATHRLAIVKWTSIGLYIVIGLVYAVFFIQFGIYLLRVGEWDTLIRPGIAPVADWRTSHTLNAPLELVIGTPRIIPRGVGVYDLVVEATNPNEEWAVESSDVVFTASSGQVVTGRGFILPNETKFFTSFNLRATDVIGSASVAVTNVKYRRMTEPPNLNWIITEPPRFIAQQVQGSDSTVIPPRVSWSVQNASTSNISRVDFQIGLYRGGTLQGVHVLGAERFGFLEERSFELALPVGTPRLDDIVLYPIVDIFDPNYTFIPS